MSNEWQFGNVSVAKVEEQIWTISPRWLFANADYDTMRRHVDWLAPHYVTDEFKLKLSIHSFVVKTPAHTILVDTCVGNHKERSIGEWNGMETPYLARLEAAGVRPEDVDYVFCTHLHVDHVGWNTRLADGRWMPTFPNARYLYNRTEYEYWAASDDPFQVPVMADSVMPIVEARLADLVNDSHQIDDEVVLVPTPGHTPGHCSVALAGSAGVITGDMVHHPVQFADPGIYSKADSDSPQAIRTREQRFAEWCEAGTQVLGTHFADRTAVLLTPAGAGYAIG